jgi:hypothetical protein
MLYGLGTDCLLKFPLTSKNTEYGSVLAAFALGYLSDLINFPKNTLVGFPRSSG